MNDHLRTRYEKDFQNQQPDWKWLQWIEKTNNSSQQSTSSSSSSSSSSTSNNSDSTTNEQKTEDSKGHERKVSLCEFICICVGMIIK